MDQQASIEYQALFLVLVVVVVLFVVVVLVLVVVIVLVVGPASLTPPSESSSINNRFSRSLT